MNMLLDYIFGNIEIKINSDDAEKCINLLHRNKILAGKMKKENGGCFSFMIRLSMRNKVLGLLDKSGIKVYSIRGEGLPFFLNKYKRRYGLLVGVLIFCTTMYVSKLFVWQITFSGNENISNEAVEKQLLDAGFGVGTYIPKVDFYKLCNVFLQQTEDFSFVSVNMEGTTAHIELRERKTKGSESEYKASNIVAKYSGQIESMTVYSGNSVVEKEAVVKEGDLLVSGFLEKTYGFEIVRSSGSVYAYVTRYFEVEIPFEKEVKIYTGGCSKNVSLSFFGKDLKIYSSTEGVLNDYDSYTDRERLVLFDRIKLPIIMTKVENKGYILEKITLSVDEARQEAEKELSKMLIDELADSEVLERKISTETTDTSYKIYCEVYCLADIALEKEIELN